MGFFDLKLIIIIALTLVCYFIYKELIVINKKINFMHKKLTNLENFNLVNGYIPQTIHSTNLFDLNNKDSLNNGHNEFNNAPNELNNAQNELNNAPNELNNLHINITNEMQQLKEEYENIQNELKNLPKDEIESMNMLFNHATKLPINMPFDLGSLLGNIPMMNPIGGIFVHQVEIPIQPIPTQQKYDIEVLSEIKEEPNESHSESSKKNEKNKSTIDNINLQTDNIEETINLKDDSNTTNQIFTTNSSETSISKKIVPLEEFSNDTINHTDENNQKNVIFKETKDDTVLKNLSKYKLPELQDIAIEYKLGLQLGNKNKNRTQLINDIKNYILNKNI